MTGSRRAFRELLRDNLARGKSTCPRRECPRRSGWRARRFHKRWTERNVIDKMSVHDVAMNPIGAGLFHGADLFGEARKIRGEDGRSYQRHRTYMTYMTHKSYLPLDVMRLCS